MIIHDESRDAYNAVELEQGVVRPGKTYLKVRVISGAEGQWYFNHIGEEFFIDSEPRNGLYFVAEFHFLYEQTGFIHTCDFEQVVPDIFIIDSVQKILPKSQKFKVIFKSFSGEVFMSQNYYSSKEDWEKWKDGNELHENHEFIELYKASMQRFGA